MRIKKPIFLLATSLLSVTILFSGFYYLKTEASKLTFYTDTGEHFYYLPSYSVEYFSNESGESYVRISDVFTKTWSLNRLFSTHWWSGSIDVWFKIQDSEIKETIARLNLGIDHNEEFILFAAKETSGLVSSDELKNIKFSVENNEEIFSGQFSRIDLDIAEINTDIERQYKLLESDYYNLENPYLDAIQKVLMVNEKNLLDNELIWQTKDYSEDNGIVVYTTGYEKEYIFFVSGDEVFAISDAAKKIAPAAATKEIINEDITKFLNSEAVSN